MKYTYYGHSCFSLHIEDKHLLFDPFLEPNPEKERLLSELKPDYILVSHGHEDHTANLVELAKSSGAQVIGCFEITQWCKNQGVKNTVDMNIGGETDLGVAQIKMVNAVHSSVLPDGSYGSNPAGFIIKTAKKNVYYSGDSALCMDMKLIPMWADLEYAILPIGGTFTMDMDDAIHASDFVECNTIIGVHYNTFPPIHIDTLVAKEKAELKNKNLILVDINQTIDL